VRFDGGHQAPPSTALTLDDESAIWIQTEPDTVLAARADKTARRCCREDSVSDDPLNMGARVHPVSAANGAVALVAFTIESDYALCFNDIVGMINAISTIRT
jgi:hypothetical protein